jgi:hypothetical protein
MDRKYAEICADDLALALRCTTTGKATRDFGMKRVIASLCICWAAFCGTQSNTAPLVFGMTPQEASIALGVPLVYYSGGPGSEVYLAYGSPGIPGFYPVDSALALQFRNGQLTGWKKDWRLRRPWQF